MLMQLIGYMSVFVASSTINEISAIEHNHCRQSKAACTYCIDNFRIMYQYTWTSIYRHARGERADAHASVSPYLPLSLSCIRENLLGLKASQEQFSRIA